MVDCAVRCRFSPCGKVNSLMALLESLGEHQYSEKIINNSPMATLDNILDLNSDENIPRF